MEPRFEVRYFPSHKRFVEFARKYMVGPRLPMLVISWVVYAAFFGLYMLGTTDYEVLPQLIGLGLILLMLAFLPHWYVWMSHRHAKKQNDGVPPETVITFGDTIELHEGMVHITVEYRKIVRIVQLKHSYVLMIGKRNGVMLDPNGFTKGTFEEFKQFLREVRPDLTLPDGDLPWDTGVFAHSEDKSTKGKSQ